jgi:hypothetical protein
MEYFGIAKGQGMGFDVMDEDPDKILRFAAACPDEYPVTPPDVTEYSFSSRKLFGVSQPDFIYFLIPIFLIHISCSRGVTAIKD